MCDKELLIGYLYGELRLADRDAFERHLTSCAECRNEADALSGTRVHLQSWAPPEPDLGFQVVRGAQAASTAASRRWGFSPAWGLAAAAMLVAAVSAAIANVEITAGRDGIMVRTGWNGSAGVQDQAQPSAVSSVEIERVTARMRELEERLAAVATVPAPATVSTAAIVRMSDADLIRTMRQLIEQSEERQQGVLARQILQVNRDMETARRTDFERLRRGIQLVEGTAVETFQRQKAFEDTLLRVGLQR